MLNRLFSRLLKAGGHFRRSDSGATAVEFAIVAFPFFALLGVIIETGSMMFTEFGLQSAVQEAARQARTGQAQTGAGPQRLTRAKPGRFASDWSFQGCRRACRRS